MLINKVLENEFYILYKRQIPKNHICKKYVIYYTKEYGGDLFKEFENLTNARTMFKKLTKECIEQEEIMKGVI